MTTSTKNLQFELLIKCGNGHNRAPPNYCRTQGKCQSETACSDLVIRSLRSIYQSGRRLLVLEKKKSPSGVYEINCTEPARGQLAAAPLHSAALFSPKPSTTVAMTSFFAAVSVATEQARWHRSPCSSAKSLLNTATVAEKHREKNHHDQAAFISNDSLLHVSRSQ